jgi:hypothetical protein
VQVSESVTLSLIYFVDPKLSLSVDPKLSLSAAPKLILSVAVAAVAAVVVRTLVQHCSDLLHQGTVHLDYAASDSTLCAYSAVCV